MIKKNGTGTKSTEVYILSGASNFQNFILQTGTGLHETDDTFAFAMGKWNAGSKSDLFAIEKSKTGTKSTEVHRGSRSLSCRQERACMKLMPPSTSPSQTGTLTGARIWSR